MKEMTSKERFLRMFQHKEADRIPIIDAPWEGTIKRWQREGMPENADWRDYFKVDKVSKFNVDISPQYEVKIIEEDYKQKIYTTSYVVTLRKFKEEDSTPEFLDYKVNTSKIWFSRN